MAEDGVVVVGDRFEEFLANKGTMPASALLAQRDGGGEGPAAVVVGQGLSGEQLARLRAAGEDVPVPVEKGLTHKRDAKNVMVGPARPDGEGCWVADLVVDELNEVLEDHITGQHIPAIALLESARQLWTVVTEEFLLGDDAPARTRFVVISMGGRFHRYVFPLPATLRFELLRREAGVVGDDFAVRIAVCQGGAVAAEVEAEYRVVPEKVSAKQERMAARQAVREALAGVAVPEAAPA